MAKVTITDSSEEELFSGELAGEANFVDECAEEDVDIPFSCHAGACMSCAGKVKKGMEHIDGEKDGEKYIETDDDVILTCVAGVKDDAPDDAEIEIEMLM
jgi:ferredoxin